MKVFGLTGGIGMGKSTAEQLLRESGVPVIDTDLLARQVVQPGQPALTEIQRAFGSQVITGSQLNREALAEIVFSDPVALQKLEAITHPRIQALWQAQIEKWRAENRPVAVVVIPLLFETYAERLMDATVCVACSSATQQQRLQERHWSPEQTAQRIAAQAEIDKSLQGVPSVL